MDRMDDRDPMASSARTGEVHTEINVQAGTRREGGDSDTMDRARDKADELKDQARDKADELKGQAQDTLGSARSRVGEVTDQARDKANQALHQAQDRLEESGVLDRIEQNPLAALGIAFGVGFLLAGSGSDKRNGGTLSKAKNQLKGAVMGGVSAALAQEAKSLVGMQSGQGGGLGNLIDSVFGGGESSRGRGGRGGGPLVDEHGRRMADAQSM